MDFEPPIAPKPTYKLVSCLTVVAGTVFVLIDKAWSGSPMTPLLALCWVMGVGIRHRASVVLQIMAILFFFVAASLWGQGWDRIIIRTSSFLVGGVIAALYAHSRERATRLVTQFRSIVSYVPTPIATVDGLGCILSASQELKDLAGPEFEPLEGHSFSDVLMGQDPPGEAMRRYILWFQRDGVHEETFSLRGHAQTALRGRVICTGEGEDRVLIAVLR